MHQKQPPPSVAISVVFVVFMGWVGCARALKLRAPAANRMQIAPFIFFYSLPEGSTGVPACEILMVG
jgi:hypothetical protein